MKNWFAVKPFAIGRADKFVIRNSKFVILYNFLHIDYLENGANGVADDIACPQGEQTETSYAGY